MKTDFEDVIKCFEVALRIRAVEEKIALEYPKGEIRCPVHLSIGQEFISAVVGINQDNIDTVVSTHRAHAHYLAKGGNLTQMIAEIYGKVTGCCKGRGGSMHLIDLSAGFLGSSAIVGSSIPIGVGAALSHKLKSSSALSFVFFGDGAVEQGVFYESINFSAVHKLPIVFICENNFYSVYTNLNQRQPQSREIHKMVGAMGVKSLKVDSSNILNCIRETKEIISYARSSSDPVFLEFETYRWLEHCGPNDDNDLGYRPKGELEKWKAKDWLINFEKVLLEGESLSANQIVSMKERVDLEVEMAFILAKKDPFPTLEDAITDIYA
jgi:TPP-dependent pyruvate/acetoin dehydrogenase alpha subunit